MKYSFIIILLFFVLSGLKAQSYTHYFTGDTTNVEPPVEGGLCLMGGATENDSAMIWFLKQAGGGDIVVIRATGSDGYNNYLYTDLGVTVNSVETLIIPSLAAANEQYVIRQLRGAEGVWIAGGDQFDYVSYWKDTPVEDELNALIARGGVIGGTSAGMAILGQAYFSAENGTSTSTVALNNPFDNTVTLGYGDFIAHPLMQKVITDTHYDNPDRKGRQMTFLSRMVQTHNLRFFGIAAEEYVAVCIDKFGIARAFGDFPAFEDFAYFLVTNCPPPITPETCTSGVPLHWDRNNLAVKTYKINATPNGSSTFDLNDWKTTNGGGSWENWWVDTGVLNSSQGALPPECNTVSIQPIETEEKISIYPIPSDDVLRIMLHDFQEPTMITLFSADGKKQFQTYLSNPENHIDIRHLPQGYYYLQISGKAYPVHKN